MSDSAIVLARFWKSAAPALLVGGSACLSSPALAQFPGAPCGCQTAAPMMTAPIMAPPLRPIGPPVRPIAMRPVMAPVCPSPCGVMQTQVRREAQLMTTPQTTWRQVTVDEGSYQTVWTPRLVTKMVPETTVRQQVVYRDVLQPVWAAPGGAPQTVLLPGTTWAPTMMVQQPSGLYTQAPVTGVAPQTALNDVVPSIAAGPVPDPYPTATATNSEAKSVGGSMWKKVPPKGSSAASDVQLQAYSTLVEELRELNSEPTSARPRALFAPVPTAATVWQSRF